MKSDLDELIELLETEKQTLEDAIKNYIDEWEYLNAHYHSSALFSVNSRLRTLYRLKDPFYLEKQQLERSIEIYNSFRNPNIDSYYKKKADEEKAKLQKLNDQKRIALYDDQKIDDALFSLWASIHNGFILYLNVKDNLGITFELSGSNFIDISISVNVILKQNTFFLTRTRETPLINSEL